MVERVEVELPPNFVELDRHGRVLCEHRQQAQQRVHWCEHTMVPLDHHERAQAELRRSDEQTAELVFREQHHHFTQLIQAAENEENQATQEGLRT